MATPLPFWNVLLWMAACLSLVVAVLLARRDAGKGTRRCRRCWYDMTRVAGLRCPECGRDHPEEHALFAGRVRWRWLAAGLLVALAFLAGTVPGRSWRRAYYAVLPTWRLQQETRFGDTLVAQYSTTDPEYRQQRILITARGSTVLDHQGYRLWIGVPPNASPRAASGMGATLGDGSGDVTGDAVPDLIIEEFSGGAHCCTTYIVVQLGPTPRVLATIDARNGAFWHETDTPGVARLVGADYTWDYWNAPHADSAAPPIILRWSRGGFRLDEDAMRTPPPDPAEVEALAALLNSLPESMYVERFPPSDLWKAMLEYIHHGHERAAYALMERAWSPSWGDMAAFRREFDDQRRASPHDEQVRALALP